MYPEGAGGAGGMSTSMVPELGSLSFWRIVDVPFETYVAAVDSWVRTRHGGELRFGGSQVLGPMEHDRDLGTRRIQVRLARGPLHPPLRMRLDIDRWSSSSTALSLIPCRLVPPPPHIAARAGPTAVTWMPPCVTSPAAVPRAG